MASVHPYETKKGRRYRVAYDTPDGKQHTKRGFKTVREAKNYRAKVLSSLYDGTYIDPRAGEVTVGMLASTAYSIDSYVILIGKRWFTIDRRYHGTLDTAHGLRGTAARIQISSDHQGVRKRGDKP